jgi:hypothetical protein
MRSSEEHDWTECDDIVALYLSVYRAGRVGVTLEDAAGILGIGIGAMRMRIGNCRSLEGQGGLAHVSRQTRDVFNRYRNLPEPELRASARECLGLE